MFVRKRILIKIALLAAIVSAACPATAVAGAGRYLAAFADGRRVSGDNLSGWGAHPGSVHLGGVALSDPKHPLLWLRDMTLDPWRAPYNCGGYVEFIGGDRIIGRVVGGKPGSEAGGLYVPTYVLVKPVEKLFPPVHKPPEHVRIRPGRIQRIVWGPPSKRPLNPGNLYLTDGRRLSFMDVRWRKDSVMLLLDKGTREVELSDVTEIHMPRVDPWKAYYRELAVLSPSLRSRLMRFETTGGLIATGSETRLAASPFRTSAEEWGALSRLRQYAQQIEHTQARLVQIGKAIDLARKNYSAKAAELQKIQAADRQAYDKALAALKQRTDQQRKTDEARLAAEHRKLAEQLRNAEQSMQKHLAKAPANQRDGMLKQFRDQQANLKKSRETALAGERSKLQKQREQQIANYTTNEPQRISNSRKALVTEVAKLKQKFDSQVTNHTQHARQLNTLGQQRTAAPTPQGVSSTWTHIIQPVWSLDPLWVPFSSIRMRWSFAPDKIPLSRVRPVAAVSPAMLPWRANSNVAGGLLRSGGQPYAWGFGVHARSELSFTLPRHARSFHCRLGLDRFVDKGGCARARVYVGSTKDRPRYESPVMIGSQKTVDTGWVSLASAPDAARRLVLQVDPLIRNHPPNADPLNIRDKFDWLDPQIALDPGGLENEVRKLVALQIAAWRGWTAGFDKRGVYTWGSYFDPTAGVDGRFIATVRPAVQPLVLSKEITVGPADKWLVVDGGDTAGGYLHGGSITLHIANTAVPSEKLPIKQLWMRRGLPLVFPIAKYKGKKVTFEMKRAAGGKPLYWRSIGVADKLPAAYHMAQVLEGFGKGGTQVPPGMAGVLVSNRISKESKLTALEINRLGGEINHTGFMSGWEAFYQTGWFGGGEIVTARIGEEWTGGDNGLTLLAKLPELKLVTLTRTSGVSKQASDKLKAEMPDVKIVSIHRSPSAWYSPRCSITVRNIGSKEVALYYHNERGHLHRFARLKPGEQLKRTSGIGKRYQAHLATTTDLNKNKPISRFIANPNAVWEIKNP